MTIERPMFPPRAESVDSFLPQPAIEGRQGGKRTGESAKPAQGPSRRNVLAGLAVLSAGLPTSAAAIAEPDPIFAAITVHRKANAAHYAAIREVDRLEKIDGLIDYGITAKPCDDENEAFDHLVGAVATTLPGIFAKVDYLREIAECEAWMLDEREGTAIALIESFATSVSALVGVQP